MARLSGDGEIKTEFGKLNMFRQRTQVAQTATSQHALETTRGILVNANVDKEHHFRLQHVEHSRLRRQE